MGKTYEPHRGLISRVDNTANEYNRQLNRIEIENSLLEMEDEYELEPQDWEVQALERGY